MKKIILILLSIILLSSCSTKKSDVVPLKPNDNVINIENDESFTEDMDGIMDEVDKMLNDLNKEDFSIEIR